MSGNRIKGPAIVGTADASVVVRGHHAQARALQLNSFRGETHEHLHHRDQLRQETVQRRRRPLPELRTGVCYGTPSQERIGSHTGKYLQGVRGSVEGTGEEHPQGRGEETCQKRPNPLRQTRGAKPAAPKPANKPAEPKPEEHKSGGGGLTEVNAPLRSSPTSPASL